MRPVLTRIHDTHTRRYRDARTRTLESRHMTPPSGRSCESLGPRPAPDRTRGTTVNTHDVNTRHTSQVWLSLTAGCRCVQYSVLYVSSSQRTGTSGVRYILQRASSHVAGTAPLALLQLHMVGRRSGLGPRGQQHPAHEGRGFYDHGLPDRVCRHTEDRTMISSPRQPPCRVWPEEPAQPPSSRYH